MKKFYHAAHTRGGSYHGWLKSKHSFSFGDYYNSERNGFGALMVINDDYVDGGEGFGTHSHRNMEIISLPLSGTLVHEDSMGNKSVIKSGDIQIMSAGTGVTHSEMNGEQDKPVQFLQIWVTPNRKNVEPRYQQLKLNTLMKPNQFNQVVSPNPDDNGILIHQDAWFNLGRFEKGITTTYQLHDIRHGVYAFVIVGSGVIGGQHLNARDGLGIYDTNYITLDVLEDDTIVLLMEVPFMQP